MSTSTIRHDMLLFPPNHFTHARSRICVGTLRGFKIYSCTPSAKLEVSHVGEGTGMIGMFYGAPLIALVGLGRDSVSLSERAFCMFNSKKGKELRRYTLPSRVTAVKMNSERVVALVSE